MLKLSFHPLIISFELNIDITLTRFVPVNGLKILPFFCFILFDLMPKSILSYLIYLEA